MLLVLPPSSCLLSPLDNSQLLCLFKNNDHAHQAGGWFFKKITKILGADVSSQTPPVAERVSAVQKHWSIHPLNILMQGIPWAKMDQDGCQPGISLVKFQNTSQSS